MRTDYSYKKENGRASLIALFGLSISLYLLKSGPGILDGYHPALYTGAIALLGLMSLLALSYSLHMRAIGAKSRSALLKDIELKLSELERLALNARTSIEHFEQRIVDHGRHVPNQALVSLNKARKIALAVEQRRQLVSALSRDKSQLAIIEAHAVLVSDLEVVSNSLDSLIDSDPIRPIPMSELGACFNGLFRLIEQAISELDKEYQSLESAVNY